MNYTILFAFLLVIGMCYGRAVTSWQDRDGPSQPDIIPLNILRNMKPSRFVPINSPLFFKSHEPCEEGFQRDVMGICREVWD